REVATGELVRGKLLYEKQNLAFGELLKVLEPSAERVAPPCEYFGACGGCDLQHLSIEAQRRAKLEMISTMLKHQAGVEPADEVRILGSDLPAFNYKRRITLHLNKGGELGFFQRKTRKVIDMRECMLSTPLINQCIEQLQPFKVQLAPEFFEVFIEELEDQAHLTFIVPPHKRFAGRDFRPALSEVRKIFPFLRVLYREELLFLQQNFEEIDPSDLENLPVARFSQGNAAGNDLMVKKVLEYVDTEEVMDLYSGAGNFAIPLAQKGHKVVAVEVDKVLHASALAQASELGLSEQIEFIRKSCEKFAKKGEFSPTVVLDPPRCGAQLVAEKLHPDATKKIIYVSCSLPTSCRDIKILCERGFRLQSVEFIDMFAQTHHVELISVLVAE
ncbi:MAG: class I SAM-dependent RNA methyltransferase, partial [Bdellovibrionales bacterium]|nr:class I SAM-dependent RNA methyltransferase [Bdellovibrionales bacterium]